MVRRIARCSGCSSSRSPGPHLPSRSRSSARSAAPSPTRRARCVSGATVLIIDEATGAHADRRHRFARVATRRHSPEAGHLPHRGGRQDFKKFEQTGVILRAAGTALVDVTLELGGSPRPSRCQPSRATTSRSTARPSRAVSTSSSCTTCRATAATCSDFLLLNPNVLGGFDDMQFLGSRTYGVTYIQDGQASTNAIFGTVGNSAPGLDAISEIQVLSNSYSAEYGGLAGVVVTPKRGSNSLSRHRLLRFQQRRPECPHLQPEARRRASAAIRSPTRTSIAGAQHRRPAQVTDKTVLLRRTTRGPTTRRSSGRPR